MLTEKKCVPCEGGVPSLSNSEIKKQLKELDSNWLHVDNKIQRTFSFVNFKQTMEFVNKVADLAEDEGHHPALLVEYGSCQIYLWTHAINGLSENDFIVAAKIDQIEF